ncbi:HAD-IA family hydrolase [Waterburya agarophytonicola K14]|uniref:HAD-IA family hydrolase n=1 Tax=Waterburya agarophytonicola KI4 TaxID=2874699 RepID=A0A964BR56_9CYAN|nr:HAD-IA family hydrolase [Waterburya agarophytonicola]MCC0177960.1 HAD-IA family hydrolase [Waterburya agarophytonicola KI4]
MTVKVILFDFDGTIADTYNAIAKITNQLSSEFGYKALDEEELLLLKNLSSREIVKLSEISIFKIPFLVRRVRTELSKEISELSPIGDIERVLFELKNRGYTLGIVTSNNKENVKIFLRKNKLDCLFSYIYSSTSIFGKHRVINQAIKNNKLTKANVIYVGDETRDIRSARRSNIGIVAVSWGFNSAEILQDYQPDYLVHQPQELLEAIAVYHSHPVTTTAN